MSGPRQRFGYGAGVASSSERRTADGGQWLVNVSDDVVVPMSTLEVIDALGKGRLSEQSLVWRIGMHDWTSIVDVPQLRLAASARVSPTDSLPHSPVPKVVAPLTIDPVASTLPHSLAPFTAEAEPVVGAQKPNPWGDLDELLSDERRADQRNTRHVVLWAALGSATLAAMFALWLLRSPAPDRAELPAPAGQPSELPVPAPTPTLEELATPRASAEPPAPAAQRGAPPSVAPRFSKRPKRARPAASAGDASLGLPAAALPSETATPEVAVVPSGAPEPAPTASSARETGPTPKAPILPDGP
jgi:hypothetical protein